MKKVVVPGTWEHGEPPPCVQLSIPAALREFAADPDVRFFKVWTMGECNLMTCQERTTAWFWHLSISHPSRHPTWDEMKAARYRLLPASLMFAILLPPPDEYVNVPAQDHVFHVHEIPLG